MRKKLIPKEELVRITRKVLVSFYGREPGDSIDLLADDFFWIGAFDFQFTMNKSEFLSAITSELDSPAFQMTDEEFFVVHRGSNIYVVCGKFKLFAKDNDGDFIQTHTRITAVWRHEGDKLTLGHIHGSNAQDVSISPSSIGNDSHKSDFFGYLKTLQTDEKGSKIAFRDINGTYQYLFENEIIYLEANLQSSFVYTVNNKIQVSGLLMANAKKLSPIFFRTHKSYVVNTKFVASLERYKVTLAEGTTLPVSKEKYAAFKSAISNLNE